MLDEFQCSARLFPKPESVRLSTRMTAKFLLITFKLTVKSIQSNVVEVSAWEEFYPNRYS